MSSKKMGGLGKLSQFSGIRQDSQPAESEPVEVVEPVEPEAVEPKTLSAPNAQSSSKDKAKRKTCAKETQVTLNINVSRRQKDWLSDTAQTIRDNNEDPVAPADRVYPQHLIQVAIDLLQSSEVDWSKIRNVEELRGYLNL
ncbi:hypothetical protein [Laspinema olomoucense]|uniref:hypothetical protein n=1 Tax=Laspinema olomoucense TaxID=3231600 RepID=UPI0021BAAC11|nr:hypothetical protein [Laspinema sp. D3d]MCT7975226.1 hypothetical protein [Laspinema sp. D3d]